MTREYDLPVLLDGTVASIEAKLPELSDAQLVALADLEQGGKTRSTLLAAIKAEQHGRTQAAATAAAASLAQSGTDLPSESGDERPPVEPGPDAGDNQDGTFADAPHPDAAVNDAQADQSAWDRHVEDRRHAAEALRVALSEAGFAVGVGIDLFGTATAAIRDLSAMLTQAQAQAVNSSPPSANEILPPEGALAPFELSAEANGESALIVMFEGIGGRPIPALGKLTFGPGDFVQETGGKAKVLARPIVFPVDVAPTQVVAVWLLDEDGEPWSRCPIVGRFDVGGGRQASIPPSFLRFDAPAQVKAAA